MDAELRRREAERQGRAAYAAGRDRNPTWPTDMLAAFDRAAAEDQEDIVAPRRPRGEARPVDLGQFKGPDE
jgi:hypothetical protein